MDRNTANKLFAFLADVNLKGRQVPDFNHIVEAVLADVAAYEQTQKDNPEGQKNASPETGDDTDDDITA